MAVDTTRVQAVFQKVVQTEDATLQSVILDRECASDTELREQVEELLRTRREESTLRESPTSDMRFRLELDVDGATDNQKTLLQSGQNPAATASGSNEDVSPALEFLQPSSKPGSLGRLGHYEVLEVLGRGGFGIVVRSFDEKLQRVVAIKVLSPELAATSPARKRFLREARAAASVRHGNIVQIHAVEEQPLPFLVMEYIPGITLQQKLDEKGPLELAEIVSIGAQIARGLAAAHEQGLIHRDVKPGNIMLEAGIEPKVKITDFGLARTADDASISQSGMISGTPLYMAPEQAKGETLDHRVDIFSLGSVLYTMASGRPPFRAPTTLAVMKRVADEEPRPIREIIPEVPEWLCSTISRMHAKDPAQRWQSAAEVANLLERHLAHLRQPSLVPPPDSLATPSSGRMHPLLAAAAITVLAILVAAMTYPLWRPDRSPADSPGANGSDVEPEPSQPQIETVLKSHELQGRAAVHDALIDFGEPERNFGSADRGNALRRAEQVNALLVQFDLEPLGLSPEADVEQATVSFYVWDPSSMGKTKISVFPVTTAWEEDDVTWQQPAPGQSWQGGENFSFGVDTGPATPSSVTVEPDQVDDTADPPIEFQLDVTDLVRSWLDGSAPNHGLAIAPVIDPSVDEGVLSRFQVYGSEDSRMEFTPKLTVKVRE